MDARKRFFWRVFFPNWAAQSWGFLPMKVLVTGSCGFIGTNLCEELLRRGHEVVGIDDFSGKYQAETYRKNALVLRHPRARLLRASVLDGNKVMGLKASGITHIVHLAAKTGVRESISRPKDYLETNIIGTLNVLELAAECKVKKVVLASTSSVYGANPIPFRETMQANAPLSVYAASKAGAEALAHSYHAMHNIPIDVLRLFTVYGPRGRTDMAVHKFAKLMMQGKPLPVFGSGSQLRDFTYVGDIVGGIMSALGSKNKSYIIYNLGAARPVPLTDVISLLEKNLDRKASLEREPAHSEDMPQTFADISKARRELGYEPRTGVEDGIRLFCEWFRGEGK